MYTQLVVYWGFSAHLWVYDVSEADVVAREDTWVAVDEVKSSFNCWCIHICNQINDAAMTGTTAVECSSFFFLSTCVQSCSRARHDHFTFLFRASTCSPVKKAGSKKRNLRSERRSSHWYFWSMHGLDDDGHTSISHACFCEKSFNWKTWVPDVPTS